MRFLSLLCHVMALWGMAQSQLFSKTIPPVEEAGFCICQQAPVPSTIRNLLRLPRFGVTFTLFTPLKPDGVPVYNGGRKGFRTAGFDPYLPLKVITHGWQENPKDTGWINELRIALQMKEPMNIILVDWSNFSRLNYMAAAFFTDSVGSLLAALLEFMQITYPEFSGGNVHLIGFSMGAHISGIAGHRFPGIARITGLDPAGPNFECVHKNRQLDPSDAIFVDNIHTNSGCLPGHIGSRTPHGHVDFYINGGGKQPKCRPLLGEYLFDNVLFRSVNVCHHVRAVKHFIESINEKFPIFGFVCKDYKTFKTGACHENFKVVFGYNATSKDLPKGFGPIPLFLSIESNFS